MAFQTQAGKYAERFGFMNLAEQGMGEEYNRGLMETAFRRIAGSTISSRNQAGANIHNAGMQFSGVAESKVPNAIAAENAGQAMAVVNDVTAQDQRFKLDMAGRVVDLFKHEDNYELQMRQLALQEQAMQDDLLSVMGKIGSIASAFTPFM